MNISELRVGNLLNYHMVDTMDDREEWDEPNAIDIQDMVSIDQYDEHGFSPIPLNEEWLVKMGFKFMAKWSCGHFYRIYRLKSVRIYVLLAIPSTPERIAGTVVYRTDYSGVVIQYVHQLQNLYFALTGQELTIK